MKKSKRLFLIKNTKGKGRGVFATREISKGELIMVRDYSNLKRYKSSDKRLKKSDHVDYVGKGEYVIDKSPNSYFNHSCDPNTKTVIISKNKAKNYAIKKIKVGEELTHNYAATKKKIRRAKKEGIYIWTMKCRCGSKKCKKVIRGI